MLNKQVLALIFGTLFVSAMILSKLVVDLRDAELYANKKEQVTSDAHAIKALIDKQLISNLGTIDALAGMATLNSGINPDIFPLLVDKMLPTGHSIMEVQLSTGTVITHISNFPDRFNSLGLDLANLPHQKAILDQTIKERRLRIVGPFAMHGANNKNIVVAQAPIYTDERLFGLAMYIIDFDQMMDQVTSKQKFAIREKDTNKQQAFYGDDALFYNTNNLILDIPLRNSGWQIAVEFAPSTATPSFIFIIYCFSLLCAAGCCALIWLTAKFKNITIRDPLTGLFNRRYLDHVYESRQFHYALCLDLDHFKKINDTYGHNSGDTALVKFASVLQNCVRPKDVSVRLGGEEFLVLLDHPDPSIALKLAERIRHATENIQFREPNLKLTTSIGVTQIKSHESLRDMLHRTDAMLYQAKKTGRNRVAYQWDTLGNDLPPSDNDNQWTNLSAIDSTVAR